MPKYDQNPVQDRRTVQARWEKSTDGTTWETDFDLTYRKVE